MSMSTVKLEGVGEGMFAELAEDMMRQSGWFLDLGSCHAFVLFLVLWMFPVVPVD